MGRHGAASCRMKAGDRKSPSGHCVFVTRSKRDALAQWERLRGARILGAGPLGAAPDSSSADVRGRWWRWRGPVRLREGGDGSPVASAVWAGAEVGLFKIRSWLGSPRRGPPGVWGTPGLRGWEEKRPRKSRRRRGREGGRKAEPREAADAGLMRGPCCRASGGPGDS